MLLPSSIEMKTALNDYFILLANSLAEYQALHHRLRAMGAGLDASYENLYNCSVSVTDRYFNELCNNLKKHHASTSPINIELNSALYSFNNSNRLRSSLRVKLLNVSLSDLKEQYVLLSNYADQIKFEEIRASLQIQIDQLSRNEQIFHVNEIISTMGMRHCRIPVKINKGRVVVSCSTTQSIGTFRRLGAALGKVEGEAGLLFGDGFNNFITELSGLSLPRSGIESRTVFGRGNKIEIACFKSKYELRITHDAFSSIEAFILVNGCDKARNVLDSFKDFMA